MICTRQEAAGLLKSIQGRKRINVITNIDIAISAITFPTKVSMILQTLTKDLRFVVIVVVIIIIFLSLLNHCESCDGKGLEPPPIQNATIDFDSLWFIRVP